MVIVRYEPIKIHFGFSRIVASRRIMEQKYNILSQSQADLDKYLRKGEVTSSIAETNAKAAG